MVSYILVSKALKETEVCWLQGTAGNVRHRLKAYIVEGQMKEHSGARVLNKSRFMRGTR